MVYLVTGEWDLAVDHEDHEDLEDDLDQLGVAGDGLVHGVVQDFRHQMMQGTLVGPTDIHAGAAADRLQPFEHLDVVRRVAVAAGPLAGEIEQVGHALRSVSGAASAGVTALTRGARGEVMVALDATGQAVIHGYTNKYGTSSDMHAILTGRNTAKAG